MMTYGVLKKIWDDHQKLLDLQCEERKVIIVQIVVIYVVAEEKKINIHEYLSFSESIRLYSTDFSNYDSTIWNGIKFVLCNS